MAIILLFVLIVVPLVEIAVFIKVGGVLGVWPTVALVIATAVAGTWLIRFQGLSVLARARYALERHTLPVAELFNGVFLLIAGLLLLTPGFVTDAAGFVLLIPPARRVIGLWLWRILQRREGVDVFVDEGDTPTSTDTRVIDGEYRDVTPENGNGETGRNDRDRLP